MKKLISVLLAVSSLALSTSAFAATTGNVENRNLAATVLSSEQTETLPCFRNGDTVTFDLSGLTGTQLTLISSKVGATADNNSIQYIDQYTVTGGAQTVTYKIRSLTNGTYNILFKDGDSAVATYYYNVANPTVAMATADAAGTDYIVADDNNGNVAYAAVATVEGATFTEAGVASVGFEFADGEGKKATSDALPASTLDGLLETQGRVNVVYGITVKGVPADTVITPKATMTDAE